jgi:TetR/AcrR family transcriptional regulator, cholesterol catabolism regulator
MSFGLSELDEEIVRPAKEIADTEARLRFSIMSHARMVTRGQGAITILVDEITALTPAQNRKITSRKRAYFDFLRDMLDELKREGKLRDVDSTTAAFSILGMVNWLSRWFRQDGKLTDKQVAEEIMKIILDGLIRPDTKASRRGLKVVK